MGTTREKGLCRFNRILLILLISLFLSPPAIKASRPARQESPIPASRQAEGRWDVKPLVIKGTPVPETTGKILEFGDGYWLDSGILLFWGKFGPDKKDQALYALKDGQIKKLLVENKVFLEPDGNEKKIRITANDDAFNARILCNGRLLYLEIPNGNARTVYTCDGEKLARVLGQGDRITIGGIPYLVRRAKLANIDDGRVAIEFETKEPETIFWRAWHDGANLTLLWADGRRLPGMEKTVVTRIYHVVSFPDAVLALLHGDDVHGTALFRITPETTERIIGIGDNHPLDPEREIEAFSGGSPLRLPHFLASGSDAFIIRVVTKKKMTAKMNLSKRVVNVLFNNGGKWLELGSEPSAMRAFKARDQYAIDEVIMPGPGKPDVLFSVKSERDFPHRDFYDLYFLKNDQLKNIPWEDALGLDLTQIRALYDGPERTGLKRLPPFEIFFLPGDQEGALIGFNIAEKNKVYIRPGKIMTHEPIYAEKRLTARDYRDFTPTTPSLFVPVYLFDPNVSVNKLIEIPPFQNSAGKTITLRNVIAWKSTTEAIVHLPDGFFLISRQ